MSKYPNWEPSEVRNIFCQRNDITKLRCHHHRVSSSSELWLCPKVGWVRFWATATRSFGHVVVPAVSIFNCADHFEKMSEEIPSCWCTRQSIVHRGAALALWQSGDDDVEEWGGGWGQGWKFPQKSSDLVKHTLLESHADRMTLREQGQGGKRTRREEEATFYPETGNNQIYCCIRSDSCKKLSWENHTSLWKESYL